MLDTMTGPPQPPGSATDIRIARIEGSARDFANFAFPQRRSHLTALTPPWRAIGAWWRGVPVGLALAAVDNGRAWLDSVMVDPLFRRRGIARTLLAVLADDARAAGASRLDTQYSSFLPARAALEALLADRGWAPPALVDITLVGLAGAMADGGGAWRPVQRAMREMTDYTVEPFDLNDPRDDTAIAAILAEAPELGVVDPRTHAALDRDISMVMRCRGDLIGWIAAERLTHSLGKGTLVDDAPSITYPGARIADGHHRALMLVAYYKAFSRQAEMHGPASRAVYRTHPGAAAMYNFTRARFQPMALHVEERFSATLAFDVPVPCSGPAAGTRIPPGEVVAVIYNP